MDQRAALSFLKSGRNIFLTGSAGTGKTHVLNQYIRYLREREIPAAITAATGIAATHLNGMTVHAWSGLGISTRLTEKDLGKMRLKKYLRDNLGKVRVLIVDEISMLHKSQLDAVNGILKFFRDSREPFGGIQVVLSGDFFQLPPVGEPGESNEDKFAFMSAVWQEANLTVCYLTGQYRQQGNALNDILNEIRSGNPTGSSIETLKSLGSNSQPETAARLYTHNADVDRMNAERLQRLPGRPVIFKARTHGNPRLLETLKRSLLAPEKLELKEQAHVMFVRNNYEKGYMNGTLGKVDGFTDEGLPIVKTNDGRRIMAEPEAWSMDNETGASLASFSQVPLRLAWAITVHKSQGMTLDAATMDLSKTFEKGQGYVALSRLRTLNGLCLTGFNATALAVDDRVRQADVLFRKQSEEAARQFDPVLLERQQAAFVRKCGGTSVAERGRKKRNRSSGVDVPKRTTYDYTREYVEQGMSIHDIARERGLSARTVLGHILKIKELYSEINLSHYRPEEEVLKKVHEARRRLTETGGEASFQPDGSLRLRAIFDYLNEEVGYDEIRLALMFQEDSGRNEVVL